MSDPWKIPGGLAHSPKPQPTVPQNTWPPALQETLLPGWTVTPGLHEGPGSRVTWTGGAWLAVGLQRGISGAPSPGSVSGHMFEGHPGLFQSAHRSKTSKTGEAMEVYLWWRGGCIAVGTLLIIGGWEPTEMSQLSPQEKHSVLGSATPSTTSTAGPDLTLPDLTLPFSCGRTPSLSLLSPKKGGDFLGDKSSPR